MSDGPLIIPQSMEGLAAGLRGYIRTHIPGVSLVIAATVIIECYFLYVVFGTGQSDAIPILFFPAAIPLIGFFWAAISAERSISNDFKRQFAVANGFQYSAHGTLDGLDGMVLRVGAVRKVSNVVSGSYQGTSLTLFTYSYVEGRVYGSFDAMRIQTAAAMPDLYLFNREDGDISLQNASRVPVIPAETMTPDLISVSLEGDFSKHFTLVIKKGYEVEALEVFTPDVMETLLELMKTFQFEVVNDHMFIYAPGIIVSPQELSAMVRLAEYLIGSLGPVLVKMRGSA